MQKKVLSIMVIAMMLVGTMALAVGCGSVATQEFYGTWYFKYITQTIDTSTYYYNIGSSYYGTELTRDYEVITINRDGSATVKINGDTRSASWTRNGDPLVVKIKGGKTYTLYARVTSKGVEEIYRDYTYGTVKERFYYSKK